MIPPARYISKAFTFIELLISVSIIIIITGALIPSFSGYIRKQPGKNERFQFINDIRSMQNKALTGSLSDKNISGVPGTTIYPKYWVLKYICRTGESFCEYCFYVTDDMKCYEGTATCATNIPSDRLQGGTTKVSKVSTMGSYFYHSTGDCTGTTPLEHYVFIKMSDGRMEYKTSNLSTTTLYDCTVPPSDTDPYFHGLCIGEAKKDIVFFNYSGLVY